MKHTGMLLSLTMLLVSSYGHATFIVLDPCFFFEGCMENCTCENSGTNPDNDTCSNSCLRQAYKDTDVPGAYTGLLGGIDSAFNLPLLGQCFPENEEQNINACIDVINEELLETRYNTTTSTPQQYCKKLYEHCTFAEDMESCIDDDMGCVETEQGEIHCESTTPTGVKNAEEFINACIHEMTEMLRELGNCKEKPTDWCEEPSITPELYCKGIVVHMDRANPDRTERGY